MLLPIHVVAGGVAILLGAVALTVRKGGIVHRRAGVLFVGAMTVMCVSAAALAILDGQRGLGNLLAALMTLYFVGTAVTTVRPQTGGTRRFDIAAMSVAAGVGSVDLVYGVIALNTPRKSIAGIPFVMFFILGTVLLTGAAGDLRVLRHGALRGGRRLARHLWRMCFALFIAAGSFFSIRARVEKVLPEPFATAPMRALPIVLLFSVMFYWLWRVRRDDRRAAAARQARSAA